MLKGRPEFQIGHRVQVFGPYQFMNFSRSQDYLKTGLNYGIMGTYYQAIVPVAQAVAGDRRIIFVNGVDPTNLILVTDNAFESIDLEDQVLEILAPR